MKLLLRLFCCLLAVLLFGCVGSHACGHAETSDANAERDALWNTMLETRSETIPVDGPALTVVCIDVGQGDCIFLQAPDGHTMLVDAGPQGSFPVIRETLQQYGADRLDVVIATHPHEDHIGSMTDVLNAYPVGAFYTIASDFSSDTETAMQTALRCNGCSVSYCEAMQTIPWSETCTVTVLNPFPCDEAPDDLNDASAVIRAAYGDTAVLLTGDAGEEAERLMSDTFPRSMLRADVLKLGHHGSHTATGYGFFLAVDPDFAVASCGKDNEYGHPHIETLSLLYVTHTALYRTDEDGTVTFRLNGIDVSVETTRKEHP